MPTVEDRLPLLIQKRLEAEIQKHPPLFPWETEIDDYDTTEPESGNLKRIKSLTSASEVTMNSD
jgi:hypothetical protein